jgi:hypothetical protein
VGRSGRRRVRCLRLSLRRRFTLALGRFVMADSASGSGAQNRVVSGHMSRHPADRRSGDAASPRGRWRYERRYKQ